MAGREAQRAHVTQSQDPLQLSLTQPDTWTVPRTQDPSAATSSCQELALRVDSNTCQELFFRLTELYLEGGNCGRFYHVC
jgi:hypothetical protein